MSLKSFFLRLLLTATLCLAMQANAGVLLIQLSDAHANYRNLPGFLHALEARVKEFKKHDPDGEVIVFANGDMGGTSVYSETEYGFLDFATLARLAEHSHLAITLGNHEALDFHGLGLINPATGAAYKDNELLYDQINRFLAMARPHALSEVPGILAANMPLTDRGRKIIVPHQDIILQSGKKLRIIGLTLATYFQESGYNVNSPFQLFSSSEMPASYLPTMKREYMDAVNDGAQMVIYQIHDGADELRKPVEEFLAWQKSLHDNIRLPIPFIGAGHMHQVRQTQLEDTWIVEAGSDYAFTEATISDKSGVTSVRHWATEDQVQFAQDEFSSPANRVLAQKAREIVEESDRANAAIVGPALKFAAMPADAPIYDELEKTPFGLHLVNALTNWAHDALKENTGHPPIQDVLTMYNTLSFGWKERVAPLFGSGPITVGMLKNALFFRGRLRLVVLRGDQVQKLYSAFRKYGEASSRPFRTPVISSGFAEDGMQTLVQLRRNGSAPLDPNANYGVVLDHWFGQNGYKIPEVDQVFKTIIWEIPESQRPVNLDALVPNFTTVRPCDLIGEL